MTNNDTHTQMTAMIKAFYHDFMPMIEQIKTYVAALNISEQDKDIFNRINEQLQSAESLLKQLQTISMRNHNTDMTKTILDGLKDGSLKQRLGNRTGRLVIKTDKDYIYVLSDTEGKVDLLDKNMVKVKEIDIEEMEA